MSAGAWDAGLYDARHAFVWEKGRALVDHLAPKPGEHILDLGCGTGQLTSEIAAREAQVLGLDLSVEMIAEARRKFPALLFEAADARTLRFTGEFDAVFSNAALHWIPEAEQVVAGVARALRAGGRFVAEFGGKGNVRTVLAALEDALLRLGIATDEARPWYYPSVAEYAALLERHGLAVREAALFDRPTELEDGEHGLANWIRMFCGWFLARVPEPDREAYVRAVEHAARPALWKGGRWELDYRRLRITALKSPL